MGKKTIAITVDEDLHRYMQNTGVKISPLANEMFRQYCQIDNEDYGELKNLEQDLDEVNQKVKELDKKRADLSMKISMIKDRQRSENEEAFRKAEAWDDTIKNSGEWQHMFD